MASEEKFAPMPRAEIIEQILAVLNTREFHLYEQETGIKLVKLAEWQAMQEQLAEARSLLYLLSTDEAEPVFLHDTAHGEGYLCGRCDTWVADYEIDHFPHAPECPWLRARALLERERLP